MQDFRFEISAIQQRCEVKIPLLFKILAMIIYKTWLGLVTFVINFKKKVDQLFDTVKYLF